MNQWRTDGLAVAAGTVVTVGWGMLFWGLLAEPLGLYHAIPEAEAVAELLRQSGTPTGTYFMPWPRGTPEQFDAFVAAHRSGGFFELRYVAEGVDPNSPLKLAIGTAHHAAAAALAVALQRIAALPDLGRRFALVLCAGALGSWYITLAGPVWFHLPWDHARGELLYETASWVLLAAVSAGLARPSGVPYIETRRLA